MKKYKICQSCGMPLKKDPKGGGTEKDGTNCAKYCSYCYEKGEFKGPEIDTPQKMQAFCIDLMTKEGTPKILAWLLTRGIPRLERWQNK